MSAESKSSADINNTSTNISKLKDDQVVQLRRELGLFSAINLIVGSIIGSGIFITPSSVLERSGSVGLCLGVWLLCGGVSLLGALAFAELGAMVPRSGGNYSYLKKAFGHLHPFWGPLPAFIYAWVFVLLLGPGSTAVILLTFAEYAYQPFSKYFETACEEYVEISKKMIAVSALGLMVAINVISVKLYVKIQNILTISKLTICVVVITGGLYYFLIGNESHLSNISAGFPPSARNISLSMYSCLYAYSGWTTINIVTEEVKNPVLNIPRSLSIAVPIVTLVYMLMNITYMSVLSVPEILSAPAVAVMVGKRTLGVLHFTVPIGVTCSTFGTALISVFTVTRLCYVAGREGHLLEVLSYIHVRRLTPSAAVISQGILSLLFIVGGEITSLIDFSSFLLWIFHGTAMVALITMRYTLKEVNRPYKVPIIVPVLVIIVALFLSIMPIIADPSPKYLLAVFFIGLGVAVYTSIIYHKKRPSRVIDTSTKILQQLLEIIPPEENPQQIPKTDKVLENNNCVKETYKKIDVF